MPMIGSGAKAATARFDPSQLSGTDKLMMLGATLRDVGSSLRGGDAVAIANLQSLLAQRQAMARRQKFAERLGGMVGPQFESAPDPTVSVPQLSGFGRGGSFVDAPHRQDPVLPPGAIAEGPGMGEYKPPSDGLNIGQPVFEGGGVNLGPVMPRKISDGLNANSPELPQLVMEAQEAGYDMGDLLKVLTLQQPDVRFDRGFGYDGKTGRAAGGYHPDLDKGQEPLYDASGRIVGVRNLDGAVQSAADMAGAVEGAKTRAQAPYQFQTFQGPDGRPNVVSNATAAALGANGGVIARGQSPAEASAAKIAADARANARVELPQNMQTAEQALSLIQQLRNHPALAARTGFSGVLPAMPGTPGADFDAMADQLRGKVFLEAYSTLKGGGQITEVEGRKAQDAIARLSTRQTEAGYKRALDDLSSVIQAGVQRAQSKAGAQAAAGTRAAPRDPGQRQAGAVYQTPRGLMQWTGTGWLPAN